MNRSSRFKAAVLVPLLVALAACGTAVTPVYPGVTLATFSGALTANQNTNITNPVALTIFWMSKIPVPTFATLKDPLPPTCGQPSSVHVRQETFDRYVAQSVAYQPQFPINFTLPITSVPVAAAQLDLSLVGGVGKLSTGVIVAYEDLNGNGSYDFGSPGVAPEPILSTSINALLARTGPGKVLMFLDGTLPPNSAPWPSNLPQGFSVATITGGPEGYLVDPPGTNIPLVVSPFPPFWVVDFTCASAQYKTELNGSQPSNAAITCAADKRGFEWTHAFKSDVCSFTNMMGNVCLNSGDAPPANWPCP